MILLLLPNSMELELLSSIHRTPSRRHIPLFTHPLYFILNICQRRKQYSLEITRLLCSKRFSVEDKQRNKRVGWTISV